MISESIRRSSFFSRTFSSSVNFVRCTTSSWVISAFSPIVSKSEMTPVVGAMVGVNDELVLNSD